MSEFRIDQIKSQDASRGPDIAGITTFTGTSGIVMPSGDTAYRGGRGRGVFAGGGTPSKSNVINTVQIATIGDAIDFGNLSAAKNGVAALASAIRGVFSGGYTPTNLSTIEYITISSTGNALYFGDLLETQVDHMSGSNNTIGIFSRETTTQFITIASTGDASDWGGDTTVSRSYGMQSNCSPTRMVIGGGITPTVVGTIDFFTFATRGDAVAFGDMSVARAGYGAGGNSTRGILAGGYTPSILDTIDYINIASTGDAIDFGNLSAATRAKQNAASSTRCVIAGGVTPAAVINTIEYLTISSTGNATDFGDLQNTPKNPAGCSDSHGGLG
jgi:hypothetical protein